MVKYRNERGQFCVEFCNERTLEQRFWEKVDKKGANDCWEWKGASTAAAKSTRIGYGMLRTRKRSCLAHRISYILHFGEIPKGLYVLHKCDTPPCVNPAHLFLGNAKDNTQDMINKHRNRPTHQIGEDNGYSKLTEKDVLFIISSDLSRQKLSAMFNVSKSAVSQIKIGNNWKHLIASKGINIVVKPRTKLTEKDIYRIRSDTRSHLEIARAFNISPPNISSIKTRRSWKHLPDIPVLMA